jgi:hypothetical protein
VDVVTGDGEMPTGDAFIERYAVPALAGLPEESTVDDEDFPTRARSTRHDPPPRSGLTVVLQVAGIVVCLLLTVSIVIGLYRASRGTDQQTTRVEVCVTVVPQGDKAVVIGEQCPNTATP